MSSGCHHSVMIVSSACHQWATRAGGSSAYRRGVDLKPEVTALSPVWESGWGVVGCGGVGLIHPSGGIRHPRRRLTGWAESSHSRCGECEDIISPVDGLVVAEAVTDHSRRPERSRGVTEPSRAEPRWDQSVWR